jgi:hypothetical protein
VISGFRRGSRCDLTDVSGQPIGPIFKGPESLYHRQGFSDVKQLTGNKSLNRLRMAFGRYCSKGPPLQENFQQR